MKTYTVYFRNDRQWGTREFVAETPEHALKLARRFADENPEDLNLDNRDCCYLSINEIEVCNDEDDSLAVWFDDDMLLRLAAPELLAAAEKVIARWEQGDLAEAVRELDASIKAAKEGAA
jgi:hypothetical protein